MTHPEIPANGYEPQRPHLAALGLLTLWVAILALPMFQGDWLAGPYSDQYPTGYATRTWAAEQIRETGALPSWNPHMFGGLPFVAAQHGDIFYLTSPLRILLPTVTVMNLGFVLHYVLAGLFTYLLLWRLRVTWTGAVVGGIAYQLSGLIASYPAPGHDGKLFVSALLPLALLALVLAVRERRWEGYGLLALVIGFSLLSPHYVMTYYLLIASGLFALYLAFGERTEEPVRPRVGRLGLAFGAVLLGFGIAMIQIMPFYEYLAYSPRAESYYGFEQSASYAIPWDHVPEFVFAEFVGQAGTYWGSNPLKLHSEYLGLPVVALAVFGVTSGGHRRRLVLWLGGIGLLFLLVSLGASTPFYRVWWSLMPYVNKTRAPGMAFFVVAFVVAVWAALGAQRLAQGDAVGGKHARVWLGAAALVALLAVTGALAAMAVSIASGLEHRPAAEAARPGITWGAFGGAVALAAAAALALTRLRGRLTAPLFASTLALVVGTDLWLNARHYWTYRDADLQLFRPDPVTERIRAEPAPYRVLDLNVYPTSGSALMAFSIPTVLGYHGFELHRYDELLGGRNEWRHLGILKLWDLLAVRFVIVPAAGQGIDSIPGYRRVLEAQPTSAGTPAHLYESATPIKYSRVVPAAVKLPVEQVVPTLLDPRMDYDRLVVFDETEAVDPAPVLALPEPSPSRATVAAWAPGRITVALDPAPPAPSYVVVAENWYVDWHATVDGAPARVLRGNQTFITVPVPAGARRVELVVRSRMYQRGKVVTLTSLMLAVGLLLGPAASRWRRRG